MSIEQREFFFNIDVSTAEMVPIYRGAAADVSRDSARNQHWTCWTWYCRGSVAGRCAVVRLCGGTV